MPEQTPTPGPGFSVDGSVGGLVSGSSVVLQENGSDNTKVTANGSFSFSKKLTNGTAYAVTVLTAPQGGSCTVASGKGKVTNAVVNFAVSCKITQFTIGGTIAGLASGQQVTLNNGTNALAVHANGAFTFPTAAPFNGSYAVTVGTQPSSQICTVSKGSGTGVTANVSSVSVACSPNAYTIAGTVAGLASGQQVTLQDNGADSLPVTANGPFTFATSVAYDGGYSVTVVTQPAGQICTVSHGSGAGVVSNVSNINIACSTNTYSIGGTISGLGSSRQVTLQNNGSDALIVSADGAFTFPVPVAYNSSYSVTVGTEPNGQTCTAANNSGSGSGVTANVTSVDITCATNIYSIGGSITGLATNGQVTLVNNSVDPLIVSANGNFVFAAPVNYDGGYNVAVSTQPTGQTCTPSSNTGSGVTANVTSVSIVCSTNAYTIGGSLTGLASGQVTLEDNGADALVVNSNSTFTFATPVAYGGGYAVTVSTQPTGQTCSVTNGSGSGINVTAGVSSVTIVCGVNTFSIGGNVSGLASGAQVTLTDNGSDAVTVSANNPFTFPTPVPFGGSYDVTVATQPTGQTCTASSYTGNNVSANVSAVAVSCVNNPVYAYVADYSDGTVSQYTVGASTGVLAPLSAPTVSSGSGASSNPTSVAIDPTGRYAYVTNYSDSKISQFQIAQSGSGIGSLTAMSPATLNTGTNPTMVVVDPAGQYAYVANYGADTVSSYAIDPNTGALTLVGAFDAGNNPRALAVTGTYVYVTNSGDGTVSQYTSASGVLTPMSPNASINSGSGNLCTISYNGNLPSSTAPINVVVDPTGQYVYVVNNGESTVSQFTIGSGGALSGPATLSTSANGNACSQAIGLTVDPNPNKPYIYVTNWLDGSVAQFTIGSGGALTSGPIVTAGLTSAGPQAASIDPTGSYLYIVDIGSSNVSQYSIAADGSLSLIGGAPFTNSGAGPAMITTAY